MYGKIKQAHLTWPQKINRNNKLTLYIKKNLNANKTLEGVEIKYKPGNIFLPKTILEVHKLWRRQDLAYQARRVEQSIKYDVSMKIKLEIKNKIAKQCKLWKSTCGFNLWTSRLNTKTKHRTDKWTGGKTN